MKQNKKRLIAAGVAGAIIILSFAFGKSSPKKEDTEYSTLPTNLSSLINKQVPGTKKILQEGDASNIIQRIKVQGTIDASMTNLEKQYSVIDQIYTAKADPSVKAILLVVNTPGGGVYESSELYQALVDSGKDIYVSMENQATSGGYYIAMAAKKIFAHQETITGSIGVVMSSLSAQEFLNNNGIKNQIIRSGAQKAVGSLSEDMPQSTLDIYQEINRESYDRFVDIIAKGRVMDRQKVLELADGRIYSAKQALDNGLIDKIGNQRDVVELIKEEKQISNPQIIEYEPAPDNVGFLSKFISSMSKEIVSEFNKASSTATNIQRNYLG